MLSPDPAARPTPGLQWDNAPDVAVYCSKAQPGANTTAKLLQCHRNAMLMRLYGAKAAPPNIVHYTEDAANSVVGRLRALLGYLANASTTSPVRGGAWATYSDPANVSSRAFP